MAYLDIWDIISERGFWEGDGSGEEVKGMLGFMAPEELLPGAEELLRGPEGREPASKRETSLVPPIHCALLHQTATLSPPLKAVTRGGCETQSWHSPAPPGSEQAHVEICSRTAMEFYLYLPPFPSTDTPCAACGTV